MVREPITSKAQTYRLLLAGSLGNTIAQFFSLEAWEASQEYQRYSLWGVRTLTPGGPCRLFCPRDEVRATAESFRPHQINVSVMVDAIATVTLMAEVFVGSEGLVLYGMENPEKGANWRRDMPSLGRTQMGLMALGVLKRNLNANSYDDLVELLEAYPDHVVEFSALDREFGTWPGRNAVVWEVRQAFGYSLDGCPQTGIYEAEAWGRKRTKETS